MIGLTSQLRLLAISVVALATVVTGCMTKPSLEVPLPQSPYFRPDRQDTKFFHALGKKQDAVISKCSAGPDCDQAVFLRALIALFENRELARSQFQKVVSLPDKSKYAPASQQWLNLLQTPSVDSSASWFEIHTKADEIAQENGTLSRTLEQLVRDLLARESDVQHLVSVKDAEATTVEALQRELADRQKKIDELTVKKEPAKAASETATVNALQVQLEQREKKIQELTHQLEALKRIDQEMREKARPIRPTVPPPTLPPAESEPKQ